MVNQAKDKMTGDYQALFSVTRIRFMNLVFDETLELLNKTISECENDHIDAAQKTF